MVLILLFVRLLKLRFLAQNLFDLNFPVSHNFLGSLFQLFDISIKLLPCFFYGLLRTKFGYSYFLKGICNLFGCVLICFQQCCSSLFSLQLQLFCKAIFSFLQSLLGLFSDCSNIFCCFLSSLGVLKTSEGNDRIESCLKLSQHCSVEGDLLQCVCVDLSSFGTSLTHLHFSGRSSSLV